MESNEKIKCEGLDDIQLSRGKVRVQMPRSQVQNLGPDTNYVEKGLFKFYTVTRGKQRKSTSNSFHKLSNSFLPQGAANSEDLTEPFNTPDIRKWVKWKP